MAILGSFLKDLMINEFKNTKRKKGPYLYHVNTNIAEISRNISLSCIIAFRNV